MSKDIIPFADTRRCVKEIFDSPDSWPSAAPSLYVVRNTFGRVRIVLSEDSRSEIQDKYHGPLESIVGRLREALGPHAYSREDSVLYLPTCLFDRPGRIIHKIHPHDNVLLTERLAAGHSWWAAEGNTSWAGSAKRYVLYSVRGKVGCSTTAAILAWHLARNAGERVMVVDLGLESPGLSPALLSAEGQPEFGVADWFVEDLVNQGDGVIEQMTATPAWARDFPGEVYVIPAYGKEPGEFLAKLGRIYMPTVDPESGKGVAWEVRLGRLLSRLEERHQPTVVLLESGSGLSDMAASAVSNFDARVLLFAVNSENTWKNYRILCRHWMENRLAESIRGRLSVVSALTPSKDTDSYLADFREHAWKLFGEYLYDQADCRHNSPGGFRYDLDDTGGFVPHSPIPIHWTEGLAADTSRLNLEQSGAAMRHAYGDFLKWFDDLSESGHGEYFCGRPGPH